MIRQLEKPTFFLTMRANEMQWPHLLNLLHRLQTGSEVFTSDPLRELSVSERVRLVNEDPVTCGIYFRKLIQTIVRILGSASCSSFGAHRVVDYFIRVEYQSRGSTHVHMLLWLQNAPQEVLSKDMPETVAIKIGRRY